MNYFLTKIFCINIKTQLQSRIFPDFLFSTRFPLFDKSYVINLTRRNLMLLQHHSIFNFHMELGQIWCFLQKKSFMQYLMGRSKNSFITHFFVHDWVWGKYPKHFSLFSPKSLSTFSRTIIIQVVSFLHLYFHSVERKKY